MQRRDNVETAWRTSHFMRLPPINPSLVLVPGQDDSATLSVQALRSKRKVLKRPRVPRRLWRTEMKNWMANSGKAREEECSKQDEEELGAWFKALDIDHSGSIEEVELRALMDAAGVQATRKQLKAMFASIGKDSVDACLTRPEFIRLMTIHGEALTGQAVRGGQDFRRGLFDANTRLMMLSYRRQRLLDEIKDPRKRRNFNDEDDFRRAYGPPISGIGLSQPPSQPLTPCGSVRLEPLASSHPAQILPQPLPLPPMAILTAAPPQQPPPPPSGRRAPIRPGIRGRGKLPTARQQLLTTLHQQAEEEARATRAALEAAAKEEAAKAPAPADVAEAEAAREAEAKAAAAAAAAAEAEAEAVRAAQVEARRAAERARLEAEAKARAEEEARRAEEHWPSPAARAAAARVAASDAASRATWEQEAEAEEAVLAAENAPRAVEQATPAIVDGPAPSPKPALAVPAWTDSGPAEPS